MGRLLLLSLIGGSLVVFSMAQQPTGAAITAPQPPTAPQAQAPPPPEDLVKTQDMQKFVVTLQQVVLSVLVKDRSNTLVNGLQPNQFRVFDNNKEQNLTSVDVAYTPISMVVVIQANSRADKILPQVNRIGAMLKPIILGDQGEVAVIAYDSRVRLMQPFTGDADLITKAVKSIHTGSESARLIDAVEQSAYLLNHRDKNRHRIILVIGEGRDYGSEAKARETLQKLELSNIQYYQVDMSHFLGRMTQPAPDPRPDNLPPAMHPMPGGVPATPTTVQQTYGTEGGSAEFVPVLVEIFHDVKSIFKVSTATLYTKGTGGEQFTFATQRGLEEAITKIGDQLHSQYTISYTPNNRADGGFHRVNVDVIGHDYKCETTPGYFMSPDFR